ncbi:MAG TPA: hypothetical protein VGP91_16195, partial [Actinoplanes sp.]|nr:hypothetical protein [Actinoplanes sp.]
GDYAAHEPPPFDGFARGENGPRSAAPSSGSGRTTESPGYSAAPDARKPSDRHAPHAAEPAPYVPAPATLPLPPEVLEPQGEPAARGAGGRLGRALRPFGRGRDANAVSHDSGHAELASDGTSSDRSQDSGHVEAASSSRTADRFSGSGHTEPASGRPLTRAARSNGGAASRDGRRGEDSTGHDDDHLARHDRERGASGEATKPKGRRWGRKDRSNDANPGTESAAAPAVSAGMEPDTAAQPEGRNTATTPATRPAHAAPPSPPPGQGPAHAAPPSPPPGQGPVWDDRTPVRGPFAPEPQSISPPLPNPEPVTPPLPAPLPVRPRASEKRRAAKQSKDADYVDWVSGLGSD